MNNQIIVGSTTYTNDNIYGGVTYKYDICSEQICLGETPSAEIKFSLDTKIPVGTEIQYKYSAGGGICTCGYFYVTNVSRNTTNPNLYDHTCYDVMSKLDKDATEWIATLDTSATHTVTSLMNSMCSYLGITWSKTVNVPNTGISFSWAFPEQGLTFRTLVSYFASFCASYVFANITSSSAIKMDEYYTSTYASLTNNDWTKRVISEYTVPLIDQVIAIDGEGDVGVSYPSTGNNPLIITGNPIFYNDNMTTAVQNIYNRVRLIPVYTPCTIDVFEPLGAYTVPCLLNSTKDSVTTTSYLTSVSWDNTGATYESVGLSARDKATSYADTNAIQDKARYNKFTRDINSTKSEIATLDGEVSAIEQRHDSITLSVTGSSGTTTFTLADNSTTLDTEIVDLQVKTVNISGTLTASQIDCQGVVDAAYITADEIVANASITSPTITGGTINGSSLNVFDQYAAKYKINNNSYVGGYIGADGNTSSYGYVEMTDRNSESRVAVGVNGSYSSVVIEGGNSDAQVIVDSDGEISLFGSIVLDSSSYGSSLPASGTTGQVFFKI